MYTIYSMSPVRPRKPATSVGEPKLELGGPPDGLEPSLSCEMLLPEMRLSECGELDPSKLLVADGLWPWMTDAAEDNGRGL